MSKSGKVICCCLLVLGILAGCTKTETPAKNKIIDEENPLLIGLIPEQNIFRQLERYEPLADYLSGETGKKIIIRILPRYGNIIDNFVSSSLDGAFFGSFTGALAIRKLGVRPLARPEGKDGISTYHGLILVRKDSGIQSIKDMKNKRFAFVDKATTAGYLLPLDYFRENSIGNYRNYLKETYFTGTHEDAVFDVLNRNADIGAAKNTVFDRLAKSDARIMEELVILAESPKVPENGLAVRKDLDESVVTKLKDALLGMDGNEEGRKVLEKFGAARFIPTSVQDYKPVFDYASHLGLDLTSYDYTNE
jgi:phosphonate transport system substrate-binding protein